MTAGSGGTPALQVVDPRIVVLEERLAIASANAASWEAIAKSAARIVEIQRRALRRLRTPSNN